MTHPSPSPSAHRRELVRQYKEAGPRAGVFAIRNLSNGRVFVGGSTNVDGALQRSRFELRQRGHRHRALMLDWLAAGEENFRFEVLDTVRKKDDPAFDIKAELEALVTLWRDELRACDGDNYNARTTPAQGAQNPATEAA